MTDDENPYRSPDATLDPQRRAASTPDPVARGRAWFLAIVGYFVVAFLVQSAVLRPSDSVLGFLVMGQWAILFLALLAAWRGHAGMLFIVIFRCFFVALIGVGVGGASLLLDNGSLLARVAWFESGVTEGVILHVMFFSKSLDAFLQHQARERKRLRDEMLAETDDDEPLPQTATRLGEGQSPPVASGDVARHEAVYLASAPTAPSESMPVIFCCPACGILLQLPGARRGTADTCRYCGHTISVPA